MKIPKEWQTKLRLTVKWLLAKNSVDRGQISQNTASCYSYYHNTQDSIRSKLIKNKKTSKNTKANTTFDITTKQCSPVVRHMTAFPFMFAEIHNFNIGIWRTSISSIGNQLCRGIGRILRNNKMGMLPGWKNARTRPRTIRLSRYKHRSFPAW